MKWIKYLIGLSLGIFLACTPAQKSGTTQSNGGAVQPETHSQQAGRVGESLFLSPTPSLRPSPSPTPTLTSSPGIVETSNQDQVQLQLDRLQDEMFRQQSLIRELENEKQVQEQRIYQMQLNQKDLAYNTQIAQSNEMARLQVQVHESEAVLSDLRQSLLQHSNLGYASDLYQSMRTRYEDELKRYQQALSSLHTLQVQAGQAAADSQIRIEEQKTMQQEQIQNQIQPQINSAKEKLSALEQKYQALTQKRDFQGDRSSG